MTYAVLEGTHGSGKSTLVAACNHEDVFCVPRYLLPEQDLRRLPIAGSMGYWLNDIAKSLAARCAQTPHVLQDRSYLFTIARAYFDAERGRDDRTIATREWVERCLEAEALLRPEITIVVSVPRDLALERALWRPAGRSLDPGAVEEMREAIAFLDAFYGNPPSWFIDIAGSSYAKIAASEVPDTLQHVYALLGVASESP